MKKQLLILILAIFAVGFSTTAYGQLAPRIPDCIDLTDPLNVVPGTPYTYNVSVPTPPGDKTYHWFVTQDINMIAAGGIIATVQTIGGPILAAGSGHYNTATLDANTISLTFQSFTLAADEYVFLGILVENTDDPTGTPPGCTTNNFKVYRIKPQHAFTLDIANVNSTGEIQGSYGADGLTTCMADILTASYDVDEDAIAYDFNENAIYFAVAAANFSDRYQLTMRIFDDANNGLQSSQTVQIDTVHKWGNTWVNVVPASSTDGDYPITVMAKSLTGNVGQAGETVYIRVLIDHGTQFEGNLAANIPFDFAVEGVLGALNNDTPPVWVWDPTRHDIHHTALSPDPCPQDPFDDLATQYIIPRPDINSVNPPAPSGTYPDGYLPIAP